MICHVPFLQLISCILNGLPPGVCVFPYVCVCPDLEFKQGDKQHVVEVEVLFDGVREMREAFTLHLKPDENMVAETQVRIVFVLNRSRAKSKLTAQEFKA